MARRSSFLMQPEVDSPMEAFEFEVLYRHYLGRHLYQFSDADDLTHVFIFKRLKIGMFWIPSR